MSKIRKKNITKVAFEFEVPENLHKSLAPHKSFLNFFKRRPAVKEFTPQTQSKLPLEEQGKFDLARAHVENYAQKISSAHAAITDIDSQIQKLQEQFNAESDPKKREVIRKDLDSLRAQKANELNGLNSARAEAAEHVGMADAAYNQHEHLIDPDTDASRFIDIDERGNFKVNRKKLMEYSKTHGEADLQSLKEKIKEYRANSLTNYYQADWLVQQITDKTVLANLERFSAYAKSRPWALGFKTVGGAVMLSGLKNLFSATSIGVQAGAQPEMPVKTPDIANDARSLLSEVKPVLLTFRQSNQGERDRLSQLSIYPGIKDLSDKTVESLDKISASIDDLKALVNGKKIEESMVRDIFNKSENIKNACQESSAQANLLLEKLKSTSQLLDSKISEATEQDRKDKLTAAKSWFEKQAQDLENHIKTINAIEHSISTHKKYSHL
jgi:hypothetical protein